VNSYAPLRYHAPGASYGAAAEHEVAAAAEDASWFDLASRTRSGPDDMLIREVIVAL
jgi:hypothetical protein